MDSQKDLLSTQLNAENNPSGNSTSTNVHEPLFGTPFWIRCVDNKWFATMGNHKITENQENKNAVIALIDSKDWNVIGTFVFVLMEHYLKGDIPKTPDAIETANKEAEFSEL